jgi:hypothetical protein
MSEDTMTHTTKDAVPNLLPCPFCGGKAYLITGRSVAWARCTGCRAEGPHFNAAAEKTNLWNRRAPTAEQAEGVLDDERAAFEAWAAETYGNDDDDSGVSLERQDDGYLYSGVDDAWNGWQARAASPQATVYSLFSSSDRRNFGHLVPQEFVNAVIEAVRAQATAKPHADVIRMAKLCALLNRMDEDGNGFPSVLHDAFQEGGDALRKALDAYEIQVFATATQPAQTAVAASQREQGE